MFAPSTRPKSRIILRSSAWTNKPCLPTAFARQGWRIIEAAEEQFMVQATQPGPRVLPFPVPPTDEHLIAQAIAGDKAAFTTLVERYRRVVYALAHRMLRHPADAEDATQETFVRAYVRLATYRPGSNFRAWLLSITAHWCIDQLRRHQLVSLDNYPALDARGDDPETHAIRAERQREVRQQIAALPEHYRQVIELRYWRDLSYAEVGDAIAVPSSTVRMRLFRAHRLMRAGLAGNTEGRGEGDHGTAETPGTKRRNGERANGRKLVPTLPPTK
jgi:RNA polymerase sigma-70 factor (ECF subfamily)